MTFGFLVLAVATVPVLPTLCETSADAAVHERRLVAATPGAGDAAPAAPPASKRKSAEGSNEQKLPAPTDRFPRSTWSSQGWTELKWGMGFGDVLDVLRRPDGPFKVAESFVCDDYGDGAGVNASVSPDLAVCWVAPWSHRFEILGGRVTISLSFWKRRLAMVMFSLPENPEFAIHASKYFDLLRMLAEKYGADYRVYPRGYVFPSSRPLNPSVATYTWRLKGLVVEFSLSTAGETNDRLGSLDFFYSNPKAVDELNEAGSERRLQGERDKL